MNDSDPRSNRQVIGALDELIEALDRRVPQLGRAEETRIAREAAALRRTAVTRREALKTVAAKQTREVERADAVKNQPSTRSENAKAIANWEDEGGASRLPLSRVRDESSR